MSFVSNSASSAFWCCSLARANISLRCLKVSRRLLISYLTEASIIRSEQPFNEKSSYVGQILQQPCGDLRSAPPVELHAPILRVALVIEFEFKVKLQEQREKRKGKQGKNKTGRLKV
jgi:hypothetical protein